MLVPQSDTTRLAAFAAALDAELARSTVTDADLDRLAALPLDLSPPDWAIPIVADLAFRAAASFAFETMLLLIPQPVALDGATLAALVSWPLVRQAVDAWQRSGRDAGRVRLVIGATVAIAGPRAAVEGFVISLGPVIARMQEDGTWPATGEAASLVTTAEAKALLGAEAEGLTDADIRRIRGCAERLARWTVGEIRRGAGAADRGVVVDFDPLRLHDRRLALRRRAR